MISLPLRKRKETSEEVDNAPRGRAGEKLVRRGNGLGRKALGGDQPERG